MASVATAISVAVMLLSVAIVIGFKDTIKEKMFVFWGHLHVMPYNANPGSVVNPNPFAYDADLHQKMTGLDEVTDVQPFALKAAILQSDKVMSGIKLKGVRPDYPLESNKAISYQGHSLQFPAEGYAHQLLLSPQIMADLEVAIGDTVTVFFINPDQETPRIRRLAVSGSFHTGMEEIDQGFGICDIRLLQRIGNWDSNAIHGYQIRLKDYRKAGVTGDFIKQSYLEPPMTRVTMEEIYPNVYGWLGLLNTNAYIVLAIMAAVAVINLSTALLIFILERNKMIAILKTMGMPLIKIQQIFVFHAMHIALKGILWGTVAGLLLYAVQYYTQLVKLDEQAYYMSHVPVKINLAQVLLIDLATLIICTLILFIPAFLSRKMNIIRAIHFR